MTLPFEMLFLLVLMFVCPGLAFVLYLFVSYAFVDVAFLFVLVFDLLCWPFVLVLSLIVVFLMCLCM